MSCNKFLILLLTVGFAKFALSQVEDPIVQINNGLIVGSVKTTDANIQYYSFTGIPYAQPPVESLRFQAPEPALAWDDVFDARNPAKVCIQGRSESAYGGEEDCLQLNVYTKYLPGETENPLPVLVYIHGGAFVVGYGGEYGPDYLLAHDMVVVTINYRLGVFGFLTTQDVTAPGNAGLKDQSLALKWVQENIAAFNGDPSRVTVSGTSAGSASAEYQVLSPLSAGLFQQAILQSGSALDQWAYQRKPLYYLYNMANALGISTENHEELVAALQNVDALELLLASFTKSGEFSYFSAWPFVPTVEIEQDGAFLINTPYSILEQGLYNKVPILISACSAEGTYGQGYVDAGLVDITEYDNDVTKLVPESMNNVDDPITPGELIKDYFFNNKTVKDPNNFIRYMTWNQFVRGIIKSIKFKRSEVQEYFYEFTFKGLLTTEYWGASHAEDAQYIWKVIGIPEPNPAEELTRQRLVTLWANFIQTGNPTPTEDELLDNIILSPITTDFPVLVVGENLELKLDPNTTDYQFWDDLFIEYGKPPFITY